MTREYLNTKEKVKKAYVEAYVEANGWEDSVAVSLNDDLESFLIKIQNQNLEEFTNREEELRKISRGIKERNQIFFTPKLTNGELKLVQQGDKDHLKTYYSFCDYYSRSPDVNIEEMKRSNSNSKYVFVNCERISVSLVREHTAENKPTYPDLAYEITYTNDDSWTYKVAFYRRSDRKDDIDHASPNLCHREFIRSLVDSYDPRLKVGGSYRSIDQMKPFVLNFAPLPDHEYFRLLKTRNLRYKEYAVVAKYLWDPNICGIHIIECEGCSVCGRWH